MSDLHGGPTGPGTDGAHTAPQRGRRVRPGAVPDADPVAAADPSAASYERPPQPARPAGPPAGAMRGPAPARSDQVLDAEARPAATAPVHEPVAGRVENSQVGDAAYAEPGHGQDEAVEHASIQDVLAGPEPADGYADQGHADQGHADQGYAEEEYADDGYGEDEPVDEDALGHHAGHRRDGRRRGRTAIALVVSLALLGGAVYAGWVFLSPIIDRISAGTPPAKDYPGPGTGDVDVVVQPGDTGGAIGDTLLEAGVVASRAAFVAEFTARPEAASLQPGTYRLREEMKASEALALLLDPTSRQSLQVAVPEGLWVSETLVAISEQTGFTVEELQTALADPAVGLPPEAGADAEGYLFPATYDFEPDVTPVEILASMVARHTHAMDDLGVPAEQRRDVLVRASIVQGEASRPEDLPKVARVIQNRLERGETLGMDSTVGYVVQKRALDLTASDLETDSPYNTRIHPGLPPGPINNPGEQAMAAALTPAEGDWLYFVTVDGDTGETVFTSDYDEFLAAKQQFQEWLAENG